MLEGTFLNSPSHPSMMHGGPFLRSYVCVNATRVNVDKCSRGTRVGVARSRLRVCSHVLARPSLDQLVQRGRSSNLAARISSSSGASESSSAAARGRHISHCTARERMYAVTAERCSLHYCTPRLCSYGCQDFACERCVYAVCNAAARGAVVRSYGRQCASIDHAKLHASCCACTGQQGIDDRSAQASQA